MPMRTIVIYADRLNWHTCYSAKAFVGRMHGMKNTTRVENKGEGMGQSE